jgi:hypothetical protein
LPDKTSKGEWVAVNDKSEIVRLWNEESESWLEPEVIVTKETYENINRWLEGDEFDYTEEDLFRNLRDMDEKYPVGYFETVNHPARGVYESLQTVKVQGVLLGFGAQNRELQFNDINSIFEENMVILGLENLAGGDRVVVPFTYAFFEKDGVFEVPSLEKINVGWHPASAPLWGETVMYSEKISYDDFVSEMAYLKGKPISVMYNINRIEEDIDLSEYYDAEQLEAAREGLFIWRELLKNDTDLLYWLDRGKESQDLIISLNLMEKVESIAIKKFFAPERD